MTDVITKDALVARLATLPAGRHLVALVGAPGSGKSTLALALATALNTGSPGTVAVVPMDGFHLDDGVLGPAGLLPRKGAPETFDVGGLAALLGRLKRNDEPSVAVPLFDRGLEFSRAGAAIVPRETPVVLVEGNYLLLDHAPWDALAGIFDLTVMIDVPEAELHRRLTERWNSAGLPPEMVAAKRDGNDLPNARLVMAESRSADLVLRTG